MMNDTDNTGRAGFWARLWRQPHKKWLLGIPAGGFVMLLVGAVGLGTANYVLHETSTTEFCLGCHSHELNLTDEYTLSSHATNLHGVRTGCSDCHLPEMHGNWFRYVATKIYVSKDVFRELGGAGSTVEKWEADRGEMARHVWTEYRENKSEFCQHCHNVEHMKLEDQGRRAQRKHAAIDEAAGGCIDCHQGIVHKMPEGAQGIWDEVVEQTGGK